MPRPAPAPAPKLDPRTAGAMLAAAVEEVKKPERNCPQVVKALLQALPVSAPQVTPETLSSYDALATCLGSTRNYRTLLAVAYRMLDAVPQKAKPSLVPRALIGLGRYEEAAKEIDRLVKLYPKDDELAAVTGLLYWAVGKWDRLLQAAGEVLRLLEGTKPSAKQMARVRLLRFEALYHLGRLDEADRELAEFEKLTADPATPQSVKALVVDMKKRSANARTTELAADYFIQTPIPLGAYHLYGTDPRAVGGALARLSLYNLAKATRQIRLEVEIPGISERVSRTVTLLPQGVELVRLAPPLKLGFDLSSVRSARPAQLALKVTRIDPAGDRVLYDETYPLTLLPRDSLPLTRKVSEDNFRTTFEYVGAWVTPNAKPVDEFLAIAKKRAPRSTFAGEQTATIPQVKALWEELQARGVSYVMDPRLASVVGQVQRTRLPAQVLSSTNAQCLEGTLLFATLMEAIGLRPIIAILPGHALVGWRATAQDGVRAGAPVFFETTLVHDGSFPQAIQSAMKRVSEEERSGNFRRGISQMLDVAALRARGVTPQPLD
jgi:tetratricopeptide (TPR) repeat protein